MITHIFNGSDDEDISTELEREVARLRAENAALKAAAPTAAAPPTPAPSAPAGIATPASTLSRQQLKSARRSAAVRSARQSARKDKVTDDMRMLRFLDDRAKANEEALRRSDEEKLLYAQESSKITDLAKAVNESRNKIHQGMEEDFDLEEAAIELDVGEDDEDDDELDAIALGAHHTSAPPSRVVGGGNSPALRMVTSPNAALPSVVAARPADHTTGCFAGMLGIVFGSKIEPKLIFIIEDNVAKEVGYGSMATMALINKATHTCLIDQSIVLRTEKGEIYQAKMGDGQLEFSVVEWGTLGRLLGNCFSTVSHVLTSLLSSPTPCMNSPHRFHFCDGEHVGCQRKGWHQSRDQLGW